jgi:hypothetical protein
MRVEYMYIY